MNEIVLDKQNLMDVSIQTTGTIEAVFEIAKKNNKSITQDLEVAEVLGVYSFSDDDKDVVNFFKKEKMQPVTKEPNIEDIELIKEGIGHWYIGRDFKVS